MKTLIKYNLIILTVFLIAFIIFLSCTSTKEKDIISTEQINKDKNSLSTEEQEQILDRRIPLNMFSISNFDSYCSYLYTVLNICIHTDNSKINNTKFINVFPEYYLPTVKELFDIIAEQTYSSWNYNKEKNCWIFNPPQSSLIYNVNIAQNWRTRNNGNYVSYFPDIAPVGMDIYLLGHYTPEQNENDLLIRVRNTCAINFIKPFNENLGLNISIEDMEETNVSNEVSLYYKLELPNKVEWRQWVFTKGGYLFAIVSAIDISNREYLLPDVLSMINSFELSSIE